MSDESVHSRSVLDCVAWFEFGREASGDGLYLYGSARIGGWVSLGRGRTDAGACTAATRRDTRGASQAKGRCLMCDRVRAGWDGGGLGSLVLVGWGAGAVGPAGGRAEADRDARNAQVWGYGGREADSVTQARLVLVGWALLPLLLLLFCMRAGVERSPKRKDGDLAGL